MVLIQKTFPPNDFTSHNERHYFYVLHNLVIGHKDLTSDIQIKFYIENFLLLDCYF